MSSPLKQNTSTIQELLNAINNLPDADSGGVELPALSNEGSASDLLSGKELIDQDGAKVTGTMPNNGAIASTMDGINTKSITIPKGYTSGGTVSLDNTIDNEVDTQSDLIAQIKSTVNNLPDAGTGGIDTSDATAAAGDILSGKTAYVDGEKVAGTFTIDSELSTQDGLISQIQSVVDSLPEAGSGSGGGNLETVNVIISNQEVNLSIWYTDINYQFNRIFMNTETREITCIKGSAVIFSGYGFSINPLSADGTSIEEEHSIGYMEDMAEEGLYIYKFTSDTTLDIINCEVAVDPF